MLVSAIIPVAGHGKRFGGETPKQFLKIGDQTIAEMTIRKFVSIAEIDSGVVVVSETERATCEKLFRTIKGFEKKFKIVIGGVERQDSVYNGLKVLPPGTDIVIVHDGVRPLASSHLIINSIQSAVKTGACIAAIPVKDTIKRVKDSKVLETIPRKDLWQIQTPQSFRYDILMDAHEKAKRANYYSTDESALVEWSGHRVTIIPGEPQNIKITTRADLELSMLYYNFAREGAKTQR
jgi:2-C-methyl-D-erythritol 4-phosphate cytidylyltransferase